MHQYPFYTLLSCDLAKEYEFLFRRLSVQTFRVFQPFILNCELSCLSYFSRYPWQGCFLFPDPSTDPFMSQEHFFSLRVGSFCMKNDSVSVVLFASNASSLTHWYVHARQSNSFCVFDNEGYNKVGCSGFCGKWRKVEDEGLHEEKNPWIKTWRRFAHGMSSCHRRFS